MHSLLWAQTLDAEQWADSVLDTLSTEAQVAQLLVLRSDVLHLDTSYRYGVGGWERGAMSQLRSMKLPLLSVGYLVSDTSDFCAKWPALSSSGDTTFIQEMGHRRAEAYLEDGVSVLGIDTLGCVRGKRQMRFFAHYLLGLCSSDLSCEVELPAPEELDLESSLPLALTKDYEEDVNQLSRRWSRKSKRSALRAACRRVLLHKYRTRYAPHSRVNRHLSDYLRLKRGLVLLRNREHLLPLQSLDTVQLASVAILEHHLSPPLFGRLDDYLEMPHYLYSKQYEGASIKQLSNYSHLIVSLHLGEEGRSGLSEQQLSFIDSLEYQSNVIWLFFGAASHLLDFPGLRYAPVLLLAHEDSEMAQDLVAQALFGATELSGRLCADGLPFEVGTGIRTSSTETLSFVPPEVLGIDTDQLYKSVDRIVYEGIASMAFPGCQILIAHRGRVFFYKSYGHHTYLQRRPVTNRSIYDLASLTKVMAATTALMRLEELGLFSVDAQLSAYLPKWRRKTRRTAGF